jgi:hypothetical protein
MLGLRRCAVGGSKGKHTWGIVSKLLIQLSSVEDLTEHTWGIVSKLLYSCHPLKT